MIRCVGKLIVHLIAWASFCNNLSTKNVAIHPKTEQTAAPPLTNEILDCPDHRGYDITDSMGPVLWAKVIVLSELSKTQME